MILCKRKYLKRIVLFFVLALCLVALSCADDPPVEVIPVLGKRDYTWTVDTLAYPGSFQTLMRDIWASSPNDVYVVGHNDQVGSGSMYHYDGKKWSPVKLLVKDGGGYLLPRLTFQQFMDLHRMMYGL